MAKVYTAEELATFQKDRQAINAKERALRAYVEKTVFAYIKDTFGADLNEAETNWVNVTLLEGSIFAQTGPIVVQLTGPLGPGPYKREYRVPRKAVFPKA